CRPSSRLLTTWTGPAAGGEVDRTARLWLGWPAWGPRTAEEQAMSKVVYMLGVALVLVSAGFLLTDALLHPPGVTPENADRIRPGLIIRCVEGLMGRPAAAFLPHVWTKVPSPDEPVRNWVWCADGGLVCVGVDARGRVTDAWLYGPGAWRQAGEGPGGWPGSN